MTGCEQLDLDFRGPVGDGYARWAWDRADTERRVAALWHLPIGQFVRARLVNIDSEFEGVLRLADFPPVLDGRRPLSLRIANLVFSSVEIERCAVVEKVSGQ